MKLSMAIAPDKDSCAPLVIGGYDCDFVEPPPDSLQCPVCLLPFRDPNLPSCCGHKGCASCLGRIKAAGHLCPLCQQPFTLMLDKYFQRKVLDLRVYCSKKKDGCGWEGELRHLQTHSEKDCGYVEEQCRYKCGGSYQRRLLQNHQMDECPQRPPEVITQSLMRKMAKRITKLETAQTKLEAVEKSYRENQAKLAAVEKAHDVDQAKLAAVEKAHCEDQAKLVAVEKTHREDQVKLAALEKALAQQGPGWLMDPKGTLSSPYTPCQIVMPRFSQHKRDGDRWYSRPFYSAPRGYKFSLCVDANGYGSGAGTHVSVFLHLMKGDNDVWLKWPFQHDVTYGILNWKRDDNHVIKTTYFKNASQDYNARVTLQEMAFGWGYPEFLPHCYLLDDAAEYYQYLHEDCLCLQVVKVEPPKCTAVDCGV